MKGASSGVVEQEDVSYNGMDVALRGEKNRFVLPSRFRKPVAISSGPERILCLSQHHKWNCLSGFGLSRKKQFAALIKEKVDQQTQLGNDFDIDIYTHSLNSFAQVPFDPSGRFVLPEYMAEVCGIKDELFLHGAGDHFTVWAPEVFYEMGPQFNASKAACRHMLADSRGKGKK